MANNGKPKDTYMGNKGGTFGDAGTQQTSTPNQGTNQTNAQQAQRNINYTLMRSLLYIIVLFKH